MSRIRINRRATPACACHCSTTTTQLANTEDLPHSWGPNSTNQTTGIIQHTAVRVSFETAPMSKAGRMKSTSKFRESSATALMGTNDRNINWDFSVRCCHGYGRPNEGASKVIISKKTNDKHGAALRSATENFTAYNLLDERYNNKKRRSKNGPKRQ